jgi:hypothetical protein
MTTIAILAAVLLLQQTPPQQTPPKLPPCDSRAEAKQFDFWVGEWDVFVNGKLAGSNRIEKILNGCVLQENWEPAGGGGTGKSWNWYDIGDRKWHQLWLASGGAPQLSLSGGLKDGAMTYEGTSIGPAGATIHNRLQFSKLPDGRVRQFWQQSPDGGKTWTTAFDGEYRPKSKS